MERDAAVTVRHAACFSHHIGGGGSFERVEPQHECDHLLGFRGHFPAWRERAREWLGEMPRAALETD